MNETVFFSSSISASTGKNTTELVGAAAAAIWYCRYGCESIDSTLIDTPQTTNILILSYFVVEPALTAQEQFERLIK